MDRGAGTQRRFSIADLEKLIKAVEEGKYLKRREIALAWIQLLPQKAEK